MKTTTGLYISSVVCIGIAIFNVYASTWFTTPWLNVAVAVFCVGLGGYLLGLGREITFTEKLLNMDQTIIYTQLTLMTAQQNVLDKILGGAPIREVREAVEYLDSMYKQGRRKVEEQLSRIRGED